MHPVFLNVHSAFGFLLVSEVDRPEKGVHFWIETMSEERVMMMFLDTLCHTGLKALPPLIMQIYR